jgi:hypothetical protein
MICISLATCLSPVIITHDALMHHRTSARAYGSNQSGCTAAALDEREQPRAGSVRIVRDTDKPPLVV